MFITFGTRNFGSVDRVPGCGHVATRFFHIQFVPLIPTASLAVPSGQPDVGLRIPMSLKSIVMGWFNAFLVLALATAILFLIVCCLESDVEGAIWSANAVGLAAAVYLTLRNTPGIGKANEARAAELRALLGDA